MTKTLPFSKDEPVPAYYLLQLALQEEIERGAWRPGEQIPTEKELAAEHGVSMGTVKRALLDLVNEGYLYRIQGKGTFVAGTELRRKKIRYYSLRRGFTDAQAEMSIRLLEVRLAEGLPAVNRHLRIRAGRPLFMVRRLFSLGRRPLILSDSYLPAHLFPKLDEQPRGFFERALLYVALEESYGVTTVSNHELFGAEAAGEEQASILGVAPGHPLVRIEMLSYTYKDKPYEYRESWCVGGERKLSLLI